MISKTDYITYLKHPARLWLRKNKPDFLGAPDENLQVIINEGREFEKLAEQTFTAATHLDHKSYADLRQYCELDTHAMVAICITRMKLVSEL